MNDALSRFHPLIAKWFMANVGTPTDVQGQAWPLIADGEHVLVSAPTGSGKTLTAFLWAINCFVTGKYPLGKNSVLYISPLKALNNDIRCNLLKPLEELRQIFADAGVEFPNIRVMTRSGDTSAEERRAMMKKPPEIFITTPETLNIMLTSRGGQGFLSSVKTVILDEIHVVIENRRGVHLITAVERLVRFTGEFQRIAISATIKPVSLAMEFAGGYIREGDIFTPRKMVPVVSARKKNYQLMVNFAGRESDDTGKISIWPDTVRKCKDIINKNNSTLIYYSTNAKELVVKYESACIDEIHKLMIKNYSHGSNILELGSGSGRDGSFLLSKGYSVIMLDGCQEMITNAEQIHPELKGKLFHHVLPSPLNYPDNSFQGVLSIATLMHLDTKAIRKVISEVYRILENKGKLIFSVSIGRNDVNSQSNDANGRLFNMLTQQQWESLITTQGFKITSSLINDTDGLNRNGMMWLTIVAGKYE